MLALAAAIVVGPLTAAGGDDSESVPGPCEDGYVAPTPVSVAVSEAPIVVESTTADYFVLYVTLTRWSGSGTYEIPVSVTRGESGSTTLSDNLPPLAADKYRVEKYQVGQPADVDGDCVDDLTELDDLGAYNPTNWAPKMDIKDGAVAIASHEDFEALQSTNSFVKLEGKYIDVVKFWIRDLYSDNPSVHFINTANHAWHNGFITKMNIPYRNGHDGAIAWDPNVVAPDGTLGVYRYYFWGGSDLPFEQIENVHAILAAAMPVVKEHNNLAYYQILRLPRRIAQYEAEKAKYDASRINVLLYEDLMPDVDYIAFNQAEGYGLLRLMEDGDQPRPTDIAIYEALPNDLPRVAGTISTIPQTPLSHVNLRAIQNGVPNAFIRDLLKDEDLKALIGKHVYYAVTEEGYTLRAATKKEVDDHHAATRPTATQTPARDLTVKKITPLSDVTFDDWDAFGVKAANMAELSKLDLPEGTVPTGFAVPFYFYDEFMKANGFYEDVDEMLADPDFQSDYSVQEKELKKLRKKIKKGTTPDWIIKALEAMHDEYPEGQSLRYRSSTNNEDLPAFNGAGLYDSKTQDPDETTEDGIDKSIKAVWASLWNYRAFLERDYYRVDHSQTAMGVLVHPNYSDELANGVAVSYDPVGYQDDMYYVNTQVGEDLVTNPEANSYPEELLLDAQGDETVLARSNLAKPGELIMSDAQMVQLRNNLQTIHDRFKTLYQVQDGDDYAIEIEFKITAGDKLAIKQARPWVFAPPLTQNPTVSVAFATSDVTEGESLELVATRSGGYLSLPLSVDLVWTETGRMLGGGEPTSLTFAANQATARATVSTVDDTAGEPESVVTVQIGSSDSYDLGKSASATVTVTDNDSVGPTLFTPSDHFLTEQRPHVVVLEYSRPKGKISLTFTGPDLHHFTLYGFADLIVFEAQSYDAPADANGDGVYELVLKMTDSGGGSTKIPMRFTVTEAPPILSEVSVEDDEDPPPATPEVSVTSGSGVTEGGNASFTVTADPAPAAPLTVNVRVGQSGDYGATTGHRTVTVTTSGSTTVTVSTSDDSVDEPDGSVSMTVNAGSGYTISSSHGSAIVKVADNDDPPPATPEVSVTSGSGVTEGGNARFTVTADPAPVTPLTVSLGVSQSGDYGVSTGSRTVTVPTSGSATVTVGTSDDSTDETDGSVTVTVNAHSGYTVSSSQGSATVSVADNDDPPPDTPEISVTAGSGVTEGGNARFTVTADPAPAAPLTVSVGVGQSGNYGVSTGARTVTVPTSGSATVTVGTSDDSTDETDGSVTVTVNAHSGYTVSSSQGSATVSVADNDDPPPDTPEISVTAGSGVTEGGNASFTVTASPAPSSPLSVRITVSQNGNYATSTGSRTVTVPTSGTATVTVSTSDDSTDETDGSITVTVNARRGYTVSSQGSATVAVADNDVPPSTDLPEVSIADTSSIEGPRGGYYLRFGITLSERSDRNVIVHYEVFPGTARAYVDYIGRGWRIVLKPGQTSGTIWVMVRDDRIPEDDETLQVVLTRANGATIGNSTATGTIIDND